MGGRRAASSRCRYLDDGGAIGHPVRQSLAGSASARRSWGLARIRHAHAAAARRAERLGFDLVELLGAHGFLLHSFLSPITNRRADSYGGSLANRMRYPLEVAAAIREVWPRHKALGVRITGTDWVDGGITPDEAGIFAGKLRDIGFDYVCVSSGGISPAARPAIGPSYQVSLAAAVNKPAALRCRQSV